MSSVLRSLGHEVIVADARRVAAITRSGRKTDRRDAEVLARLLQGMPELLGAVHHRGEQSQADLALIRARDLLVRTRTRWVQHVRGTLKGFGLRARSCSASAFHRTARESVPQILQPALGPMLDQLAELQRKIRHYDREIERVAVERHSVASRLRQVCGVGPLTSLAFVLTLDDPARFEKSRTVGSWVGLCPSVQASGDHDPQLSISKTGSSYLRRLLVSSAQYLLGPFGKDCDLRRYGLRICERGGKAAKGRAVVAVARKLAVLLHRLWVSGQPYEPLRSWFLKPPRLHPPGPDRRDGAYDAAGFTCPHAGGRLPGTEAMTSRLKVSPERRPSAESSDPARSYLGLREPFSR